MAGRINLRGYDPRLAEEADQRQRELAQSQLGQLGELGAIETQGIKGLGDAASDAVTGGVNGYFSGKKAAEESAANAMRLKLAQQNLDSQAAEEEFLDAAPGAAPQTNRQQFLQNKLNGKATADVPEWSHTGRVDSSNRPILFNRFTGEEKILPVSTPSKAAQEITPYQKEMKEARTEDKLDRNTRAYSDKLARSNVPTAIAQLERVYTMLPPEGDAPGYGRVTGALPDALVSQKGEDLRQGVQAIFNIELKDRSGAAVSDQELNRLKKEFGEGSWKTSDQLRKGLAQYENRLKEVVRNINAGEDPTALQEYVKRGGRDFGSFKGRSTPAAPVAAPAAAASGQKTPVKKQYSPSRKMTRVTYSDGSIEEIPDGGR